MVESFERFWPLAMIVLAPAFVFLNYHALAMQGIVPNYLCFRQLVLSGGLYPATCAYPTFPMWGYGFVLAATDNQAIVLLVQNLAAIGAAWFLLRTLEQLGILRGGAGLLVRLALVVSVPWYAFQSVLWPYGVAVSLSLVSLALLLRGLDSTRRSWGLVALSGLVFGLSLNLRSDYIGLPLVLAAVVVAVTKGRRVVQASRMVLWCLTAVLSLLPWAVYSHAVTGHVLLTSTNSGHVLFISLGQLPGNPWHIVPTDGDPRMAQELDAHFGHPVLSLSYEGDAFLRQRFVQLVEQDPGAYLRKVIRNTRETLLNGFYSGEFALTSYCQPHCMNAQGQPMGTRSLALEALSAKDLSPKERLGVIVQVISLLLPVISINEGRLVSLLGFAVLPFMLGAAVWRRDVPLVVLSTVVVYQILVNTLSFYMAIYSSNVYLLLLVELGVVGQVLKRRAVPDRSDSDLAV